MLQQIVAEIIIANSIASEEVLQLDSVQEINSWLLQNPARAQAAVLFDLVRPQDFSFVLQINTTSAYWKGKYRDPNRLLLSLQLAVESAWTKINSPLAKISIQYQIFPHPSLSTTSVSGAVLPVFILASIMISFVSLLSDLVSEKEEGRRHMMRTQGLLMLPYWLSWLIPQAVQGIVHSCLLVSAARAFSFQIVIANDFSLMILLIFLCNLALMTMAMAISCLLDHSSLSVPVSMGIFLFAWITQLVVAFGLPYGIAPSPAVDALAVVFATFPFTLLSKAVLDLSAASAGRFSRGISWERREVYCYESFPPSSLEYYSQGPNCSMSISQVFAVLPLQCLCYLILTLLLDLFLPRGTHDPEPVWLLSSLCNPLLWRQAIKRCLGNAAFVDSRRLHEAVDALSSHEDHSLREVKEETMKVSDICRNYLEFTNQNPFPSGLYLCGLRKVYRSPWYRSIFQRGKSDHESDPWSDQVPAAVDSIWLSIAAGECLCILGPNGAGKSTTIKTIIGSIRPTHGDVIVNGNSILCSPSRARASIGVCSQFDALWSNLSAKEHLSLVFDLKASSSSVTQKAEQIDSLLRDLRLTDKADEWAGKLSGGMRRRLSVAMAMMGSPSVVLFDEPSSGLDEVSRRALWDLIADMKKRSGTAILLTTHSMEEAEFLADRCSIMKEGKLCCLGSPLELRASIVNGGRRVKIDSPPSQLIVDAAKKHLDIDLDVTEGSYSIDFVMSEDEVKLLAFLDCVVDSGLEEQQIHISLNSLEEAYLSIVSD